MRLLTLASALLLGACNAGSNAADAAGHDGSPASQRTFDVGEFRTVALDGFSDVVVHVGGPPSVRAEGPAEALDRLDIRVENGVLKIGQKKQSPWSNQRRTTVYVTAPSLEGATLAGAGDMRIDAVAGPRFTASLGGLGDMDVGSLKVEEASLSVAGKGSIMAAGTVGRLKVSISGLGDVDAAALQAQDADVSIAGLGDAAIQASGNATLAVSGAGDITVHGKAKCSISKTGLGDVRCVG